LNYKEGDKKVAVTSKEKIREVYEALPKPNCGYCGFGNCGEFARAVVEGRASPFGCRQNPWAGYKISELIRIEVPVQSFYGFQPAPVPAPAPRVTPKVFREGVQGLSQRVDDILARIAKLKTRK